MPYCTGLYIAVPAYNKIWTSEVGISIANTRCLLQSQGIKTILQSMGCADIANLRNLFLSHWYHFHPETSHMVMIDADMHFSEGMIWDMLCFGKPLTGAIYCKREEGNNAVGHFINDHPSTSDIDMGHMRVQRVGAGVLLIQRAAIDEMIQKIPTVQTDGMMSPVSGIVKQMMLPSFVRAFAPMHREDGSELSEDLSFCQRWLDCGGEIWANVHHPIGHIGGKEYGFCLEAMLKSKEEAEIKVRQATHKWPLDEFNSYVDGLPEYTHQKTLDWMGLANATPDELVQNGAAA